MDSSLGSRIVEAAIALRPLGLTLLVSRDEFVITDNANGEPCDDNATEFHFTTIGQVEQFIADRTRPVAAKRGLSASAVWVDEVSDWANRRPRVGDIVHYVSYGTPGGEYTSQCRAAIVTEVSGEHSSSNGTLMPKASLCVLNPTGQFFKEHLSFGNGAGQPGKPDCAQAAGHGNPFRYCACGWTEPSYRGGTWHWAGHE